MTSSTSSSDRAALVAAVAAPAVLVAAALFAWGRPIPTAADDGCLHLAGDAVVLVGNSKLDTDIDRRTLMGALGGGTAGIVGGPGTGPPLWYAALDRCLRGETKPELIVVYATAGAMLGTTVEGDRERADLDRWRDADDPVIARKVLGGEAGSPLWSRVRARRAALAEGLQDGVRDVVAGLLFAPRGPDGLLASGRAFAEPALAEVFGAGPQADARARAVPIAEDHETRPVRAKTVEDTLVPDLVALADDVGARVVFVNAPVAATVAGTYDAVDAGLVGEVVASLGAAGAGWLDLTALDLPRSAYGDGVHMNLQGRTRLTAALGDGLVSLDALGDTPFPAAHVPRPPPRLRRLGVVPTLPPPVTGRRGGETCDGWQVRMPGYEPLSDPALAQRGVGLVSPIVVLEDGEPLRAHARSDELASGCVGASSHQGATVKVSPSPGTADEIASRAYDVVLSEAVEQVAPRGQTGIWVYPGTGIAIELDVPWTGTELSVEVEALVVAPGRAPASLSVPGVGATALDPAGDRLGGRVSGAAPGGDGTVEIRSPAAGPWLLLRRVTVTTDGERRALVGAAHDEGLDLLLHATVTYAGEPPPIGPLGPVLAQKDDLWRFDTSAIDVPHDSLIYDRSGVVGGSPLIVLEDGVPLARLDRDEVPFEHQKSGFHLRTSDGSSPLENGRTYTVALAPDRAGRRARWLYPGDRATLVVDGAALGLAEGATRLDLGASTYAPGDPEARVTVRVEVDGRPLLDAAVPASTLATGAPQWTLSEPILGTSRVTVELSTPPDAPWVLVTALGLVDGAAVSFAP